jgi:hypothetical protein
MPVLGEIGALGDAVVLAVALGAGRRLAANLGDEATTVLLDVARLLAVEAVELVGRRLA